MSLTNNVLTRGAATLAGTAFDYATPGRGSSRVTDWGAGISSRPQATLQAPKPPTSPSYSSDTTSAAIAALHGQYDDLMKQSQALQAQLAAQPKLPKFDYAGSYANAQATAANTVNPVYQDKLNQYLSKAQAALGQKQVDVSRNKEDIQTSLTQALQDSQTNRQQTNEDVATKLGDIGANEGSYQIQEGRQFDAARTALLGDVANSGLTESGIGQGKINNATVDRNNASADQVRTFDNQKRDTNLFQTRTLADLDKSDTRAKGGADRSTQAQDIDLNNFIQNSQLDEQGFRANNEMDRVGAVNSATQSAYQNIVAQTIAALSGGGARAQDVALFKQVYG